MCLSGRQVPLHILQHQYMCLRIWSPGTDTYITASIHVSIWSPGTVTYITASIHVSIWSPGTDTYITASIHVSIWSPGTDTYITASIHVSIRSTLSVLSHWQSFLNECDVRYEHDCYHITECCDVWGMYSGLLNFNLMKSSNNILFHVVIFTCKKILKCTYSRARKAYTRLWRR